MKRDADDEAPAPVVGSRFLARFDGVLRWLRRPSVEILEPDLDPPAIVVACSRCGFDYDVRKIDFGGGRVGAFWTCACGSQYIPPGGKESFSLVRP